MSSPTIHGVLETCLYADELEATAAFFERVLDAKVFMEEPGRHVFMRIGASLVFLFRPAASRQTEHGGHPVTVPPHGADGAGHLALSIPDSELEPWRARLAAEAVPIEEEIEWPNGARSLYFRDPAGNSLELATRSLWAEVLEER